MSSIRVLHGADFHLDSPFSLKSPREAERRRTELRSDLSSVMVYIRMQKVQLCLLSGDLFDGEAVTPETRALLERELSSCPDCRFFLSPGNHDPLSPSSPYRQMRLPENVHVFGAQKECVRLDELGVDVYGFGFDGKNGGQNPLFGYPPRDPSRLNILVCHGELDGSGENGPFTRADLAACGFDYVALGHIHKGTGLQCEQTANGPVYWAYPGCLEGRGFDETGEKGVLFGTLEKADAQADLLADLQFVRMSKRRYEIASCDVTGCDRLDALEKVRALARGYGADTTLRVVLTGEVKDGLLLLPEELSASEGACAVETVDKTVLAPDFTSIEQSGTLKGAFFRLMREKGANAADGADSALYDEALKYGLLALDDRNIADIDFQGF